MNAYIWSAMVIGGLMAVSIMIGRFIKSDVSEADVQRELDPMDPRWILRNGTLCADPLDPHGLQRSFERRDSK